MTKVEQLKFTIKDVTNLAIKKAGIEGWMWYQWRSLENDEAHVVTGNVPYGVYERGEKKGRPRFSHPKSTHLKEVLVTKQELIHEALSYIERTGRCWNCKGSGQVWTGWSKANGSRFKPCPDCDGCPHDGPPDPEVSNIPPKGDQQLSLTL